MNKEEELFQKRLEELAPCAGQRDIVCFTDFMNLNELNIFHNSLQKFSFVKWKTFGGYESAERQMAAFIPDALSYEWEFPISCLKITPLNKKFAEKLTHRDYLGAILNLGIDRSKIGDIILGEEGTWFFCHNTLSFFLCDEIHRIRHTEVSCMEEESGIPAFSMHRESVTGSVSSVRLDSVIALAFKGSRSALTKLIGEGKVFVNGRLVTSNGYGLKEEDIISVRGMGKFKYLGERSRSKKGKILVEIEIYR